MSDLVNPVLHILVLPTKKVQCLMSVCLRMFKFDYQRMNTFESFRCSKNDIRVHSMFDK